MGFHLIAGLPKGSKFNAGYYVSAILEQLAQLPGPRGGERRGKLFVHADNARPHTARMSLDFCDQNKLSVVSHPAYSPDLSPCDFWLFGHLKSILKGRKYDCPEELLSEIESILSNLEQP